MMRGSGEDWSETVNENLNYTVGESHLLTKDRDNKITVHATAGDLLGCP